MFNIADLMAKQSRGQALTPTEADFLAKAGSYNAKDRAAQVSDPRQGGMSGRDVTSAPSTDELKKLEEEKAKQIAAQKEREAKAAELLKSGSRADAYAANSLLNTNKRTPQAQRDLEIEFSNSPEALAIIKAGGSIQDAEIARLKSATPPQPVKTEETTPPPAPIEPTPTPVNTIAPPVAPTPAPINSQAAPSPEVKGVGSDDLVKNIGIKKEDKKEEKRLRDSVAEMYKKYGPRLLEFIQAAAYGYAGIDKPLYAQIRKAEEKELEREERQKKLTEEERQWQERLMQVRQDYEKQQALEEFNRRKEYDALMADENFRRQKELLALKDYAGPTEAGAYTLDDLALLGDGRSIRDIVGE